MPLFPAWYAVVLRHYSAAWIKRFISIGVLGMLYAGIDEYTQRFVPGRTDFYDFVDSWGYGLRSRLILAKLMVDWEKRLRKRFLDSEPV